MYLFQTPEYTREIRYVSVTGRLIDAALSLPMSRHDATYVPRRRISEKSIEMT